MQPFVVAKIIGRCQQIRCQTFLSLMFASRINVGTRNVVIVENLGIFFLFCDERPSRVRYVIGSAPRTTVSRNFDEWDDKSDCFINSTGARRKRTWYAKLPQ